MRYLIIPILLLSSVGCVANSGLGPVDLDDPDDTDTDDEIPWEDDSDGSEIWELAIPDEKCEAFTDADGVVYPIPGATRYFAGDYDIDLEDGTVTGREYWLLVANERWKELGEEDCQVVWGVVGTVGDASCAACDYSISIVASMNQTESNCPGGLQDLESDWSDEYDVTLTGNTSGDTTFRWLESQNVFGEGWWANERAAWISESACMWF